MIYYCSTRLKHNIIVVASSVWKKAGFQGVHRRRWHLEVTLADTITFGAGSMEAVSVNVYIVLQQLGVRQNK